MDPTLVTFDILLFLFVVAIVAGCIDTLAGGGGLLALPALLMCGVPPLIALGTNKLQGSMGTATATFFLMRKRKFTWKDIRSLMLTAFVGASAGAILVQFIDTSALRFMVPAVLLLIAVYFLVVPLRDLGEGEAKVGERVYRLGVIPAIGCYDGMFGPGTGSFFALSGVSLRGQDLIQSTSFAKALNFSTNISSLVVFLIMGKVTIYIGCLMMVGQMAGAWAGGHILLRIKPGYLRYLVVLLSFTMVMRYIYQVVHLSMP